MGSWWSFFYEISVSELRNAVGHPKRGRTTELPGRHGRACECARTRVHVRVCHSLFKARLLYAQNALLVTVLACIQAPLNEALPPTLCHLFLLLDDCFFA